MIREAQPADCPAICAIYASYVDFTSYSFEWDAPNAADYAQRMQAIKKDFPFYVYEENGAILGYAYAHAYHERQAYGWLCETTIYTDCRRRKPGVARELYGVLLGDLAAMGYNKAIAILGCPNEASERFHQKMGFVQTGHFKNMGYKFGQWHDTKYYEKTLNEPTIPPRPTVTFAQMKKEQGK